MVEVEREIVGAKAALGKGAGAKAAAAGKGAGAKGALAAGKGARVSVRTYPKADFDNLEAATTFVSRRLTKKLPDVKPTSSEIKVNGKPAMRLVAQGTEPNGVNKGYIITVFEGATSYIGVVVSANASAFDKQKALLEGIAGQVKLGTPAPTPQ